MLKKNTHSGIEQLSIAYDLMGITLHCRVPKCPSQLQVNPCISG